MKNLCLSTAFFLSALTLAYGADYESLTKNFITGKAEIHSMSVMTFSPEGILFIGDSKGGKIFALALDDRQANSSREPFELQNIESQLASLLGTQPSEVIIHDLAVNPVSQNIYLAVSRADATQVGFWKLPNDIADATILLRLSPQGDFEEVSLDPVKFSEAMVPKVIQEGQQNWRKSDLRTEAITDIAYEDGKLYVAGLSNEEFASSLRVLSFPFTDQAAFSTIEVWHVAHGKSETEAPIRTLLPYEIQGQKHLLASYTCTPFVSIAVNDLKNGQHIKSKTLAEFGAGNMPIDIIKYQREGKEYLLMSSSSKALIRIDPQEIPKQAPVTTPLEEGQFAVGLPHSVLSKVGITQIDNLNSDHVLVLQRMPNGQLNLNSYSTKWL